MEKKTAFIVMILALGLSSAFAQNNTAKNNSKKHKMEHEKIEITGHKFKADFGMFVFELNFQSETQLTFTDLKGSGGSETVVITKTEIRPNVYMVVWKEKSGTTVTHVEDFENQIVYTNITASDFQFYNLKGTLTLINEMTNK